MSESLPFSQACENNKDPILAVLRRHFAATSHVLEIGSGTGQHAEYFAAALPHLRWQSTDLAENLAGLNRRLTLAALPNLPSAVELDVTWPDWSCGMVDGVFSANSLHIMAEPFTRHFFHGVGRHLVEGGRLLVYGPFKYRDEFTTQSNADFDLWLKSRDPVSGIRDFETVNRYAMESGLEFLEDNALPANNQLLVWERREGEV